MAANFWVSSHCESWLFDSERVLRSNPHDLQFFGNKNDITLLRRYFMDFIAHLGFRLGLRQRVIATAQVFFKRFYLSNSFIHFDPRLAAPTMLFVAAKVEESPINAKIVLQKLNRMEGGIHHTPTDATGALKLLPSGLVNESNPALLNPGSASALVSSNAAAGTTPAGGGYLPYLYEIDDLLEMEFAVLAGLKYDLIVYHPYHPLKKYLNDMQRDECLQMAWEMVNDSYRIDLPLLYPPYQIAIAAIYLTLNFMEKESNEWLASLQVDLTKIMEIAYLLIELWDDMEKFVCQENKQHVQSLLNKLNEKKFQTLHQMRDRLKLNNNATQTKPGDGGKTTAGSGTPSASSSTAGPTATNATVGGSSSSSHAPSAHHHPPSGPSIATNLINPNNPAIRVVPHNPPTQQQQQQHHHSSSMHTSSSSSASPAMYNQNTAAAASSANKRTSHLTSSGTLGYGEARHDGSEPDWKRVKS